MRNDAEKPQLVIWETTADCAEGCGTRQEELTTEEAMRLVDQVAAFETSVLVLSGSAPLERSDLRSIVRYATLKGVPTALSPAAGHTLPRAKLVALREVGLKTLVVDLDAADAVANDSLRGTGSYQRTLQQVRDANAIGLPVEVTSTIMRKNAHQLASLAALVEALHAVRWNVFFCVPAGRQHAGEMVTPAEAEHLLQDLYGLSRRMPFEISTVEAPNYQRIVAQQASGALPCGASVSAGRGLMFVSYDGDICPSGYLPLSAANVRQQPLGKTYRDAPLFRLLRDADHLHGKCRHCPYRWLCGGSRARAYQVNGDALGPDPCCAYVPPEAPCDA